jgi:uncharacterized membrane protein
VTVTLLRRTYHIPRRLATAGIVLAGALIIGGWLWATPQGVLGKADAVGYAICHRIAGRSFSINGRPLPLCVRCSGMYIGALLTVALAAATGRARASGLPPRRVSAVLLIFLVLMGVDGINSYLTFFPALPHAYEPHNALRLFTGLGTGLAMGAFVLPAFNGTLWRNPDPQPILGGLRELGALALVAAMLGGLILTENTVVLHVLALGGVLGVLALLAMIQLTLWASLLQVANRLETWRGAALPLLAGLTLAVAQVAVIDAARFAATGTWSGFVL